MFCQVLRPNLFSPLPRPHWGSLQHSPKLLDYLFCQVLTVTASTAAHDADDYQCDKSSDNGDVTDPTCSRHVTESVLHISVYNILH